jgi:hypothetical protein
LLFLNFVVLFLNFVLFSKTSDVVVPKERYLNFDNREYESV